MNPAIEAEGNWLVSQGERTKAVFLATLMHAITIAGRNSYRPQTEELDKPAQLRKVNEIQHRIAACLRQVLCGQTNESFERSIAAWVLEQQDTELRDLMSYAWYDAKDKLS
jgi:hypothetical protein